MFKDIRDLINFSKSSVRLTGDGFQIINAEDFRERVIDRLVYTSVFHSDRELVEICRYFIFETAKKLGAIPSSIYNLYQCRALNEFGGFSVPAINIRGLTYDVGKTLFRTIKELNVGAFIFEIARSEIDYTNQQPAEYTTVLLGAAIKENFQGPVFFQGDHFQINAKKYKENKKEESITLKKLINEAIAAEFYNIDIDSSTMVDINKDSIIEQQRPNFEITAEFIKLIRNLQPSDIMITIGGEIGEIGGKNSTVEELRTYMDGLKAVLTNRVVGISKISVQTGATHGGVVLPDGSIAKVNIDFDTLEKLSRVAREEYGLAGAVQHGASTLPDDAFHLFPGVETCEVHLATGFQNIVYDNPFLPDDFRNNVYKYLREECGKERDKYKTDEQFIYKTRKKGFGPFKKEWWDLPQSVKTNIMSRLKQRFKQLFKLLNVLNTKELVDSKIDLKPTERDIPQGLKRFISV